MILCTSAIPLHVMVIILFSLSILVMLTNIECCHKLSLLLVKSVGRGIEANDGGQIMDDFTITKMHYLVVSLFCDLMWPLFYLYLQMYVLCLRSSLCFISIKLTIIGISPLCSNLDCSRTALKFERP